MKLVVELFAAVLCFLHFSASAQAEKRGDISADLTQSEEQDIDCLLPPPSWVTSVTTVSSITRSGSPDLETSFAGTFDFLGMRPIAARLSDADIIDEESESDFKSLVGASYGRFLESLQLIYDNPDLDGVGAKVRSGSVRGRFGVREAIVMSTADHRIWAAVISTVESDSTSISYFTNVESSRKVPPETIRNWLRNFDNVRLISADRSGNRQDA